MLVVAVGLSLTLDVPLKFDSIQKSMFLKLHFLANTDIEHNGINTTS